MITGEFVHSAVDKVSEHLKSFGLHDFKVIMHPDVFGSHYSFDFVKTIKIPLTAASTNQNIMKTVLEVIKEEFPDKIRESELVKEIEAKHNKKVEELTKKITELQALVRSAEEAAEAVLDDCDMTMDQAHIGNKAIAHRLLKRIRNSEVV